MKIQNAEMEFVAFDAQDVIATSGGDTVIKFVFNENLYTGPYGSYSFNNEELGTGITWYEDTEKKTIVSALAFAFSCPQIGDTVYLDAENVTCFSPYDTQYTLFNISTSPIDGAVEKNSLSDILDWLTANNLVQ